MFLIYNFLIYLLLLLSPIVIIYRIIIGKEDSSRFLERFCVYKKINIKNPLIWFHTASVGEMMSIIPVLKKLEKNKNIKKILVTSTTTSSANIFLKFKFKKIIHKYFPIDSNLNSKKFIKLWKPKVAIFVESEIWPNTYKNLYLNNIPIILLNARITKKTFEKWFLAKKFAKNIFSKISLALPQNEETAKYLKYLGVKKIKICGNLKYFGDKTNKDKTNRLLKKFKRFKVWCAASTHHNEEILIGKIHKKIKRKINNLLTIIIPRHIRRTNEISSELKNLNLDVEIHSQNKVIRKNTDIYLVDSFGISKNFYQLSNITFMGGSIIPHGGQNPLEPARQNNYIIHGSYIKNFREIYSFLKKNNISFMTNNSLNLEKILYKKINQKVPNSMIRKINTIGEKILKKNLHELNNYIK